MTRAVVILGAIGAVLVGLTGAGTAILTGLPAGDDRQVVGFLATICLAGLLWLLAVAIVRRSRMPRQTIWLVLAVAVAMRLMTLATPPLLSSDIYRYVWDGRVQLAGINPYRYLPAAAELSFLRDQAVYPNINRAEDAHTVYPPGAQAIFALAAAVTPGVFGMKLMMTAFDVLTIAALIMLLRIAGRDPAELLIYAWLPLPVWEFAGNAHIDGAAAGLLALALLCAVRVRPIWTGILLGIATLTKFLPAVVLPAFWRPSQWRLPIAFVLTIIACYIPYVSVGSQVFGFLPGYVSEEGFRSGQGIFLLQLLDHVMALPSWATTAYVALVLALLGLLAAYFSFGTTLPTAPGARVELQAEQALILGAVLLVALSPHYPWYVGWLAPLACLAPRLSVLWMLAAAPLLAHGAFEYLAVPGLVYGPAIILALIGLFRRTSYLPLTQQAVRSAR